jgi:hypothetical protein
MNSTTSLDGGCLCGRLRYHINGEIRLVCNCHCTICRHSSGAPMLTWLAIRKEYFTFLKGSPRWYHSSEYGRRGFCMNCGSQLISEHMKYSEYYEITAGSLDKPESIRLGRHVYEPDRLPWVVVCDGLPRHVADARSPLVDPERYRTPESERKAPQSG